MNFLKAKFAVYLNNMIYVDSTIVEKDFFTYIYNKLLKNQTVFANQRMLEYVIYYRCNNDNNVSFQFNNGYIGNISYSRLVKYTNYHHIKDNVDLLNSIYELNVTNKVWTIFNIYCCTGNNCNYILFKNILNLSADEEVTLWYLTYLLEMKPEKPEIDHENLNESAIKMKLYFETLSEEFVDNTKHSDYYEYSSNYEQDKDEYQLERLAIQKESQEYFIKYIINNITPDLNDPIIQKLIYIDIYDTFTIRHLYNVSKFKESHLETFILNNNFNDEEYIQIKQRLIILKNNSEKYQKMCIKKDEEEYLKLFNETRERKRLLSSSSTSTSSTTEVMKLYEDLEIEHQDLKNEHDYLKMQHESLEIKHDNLQIKYNRLLLYVIIIIIITLIYILIKFN